MTVFNPRDECSPCYAGLYPERGEVLGNCRGSGILAPVVGVVGSLMAVEAIKLITDIGRLLSGRLWRLKAVSGEPCISQLKRRSGYAVCGLHV